MRGLGRHVACTLAWAAVAALPLPSLAAGDLAVGAANPSTVSVAGAATTRVANDRMQATLRYEAENASATVAGHEVNARMAKALAIAKGVAGIETRSVGYNTWQSWEKNKPGKWRVSQSIQLTGADFPALAALVTRLQDEQGLLVSGITFSMAPETRRKAEDGLTREAIRSWQQRAALAADALGFASWRTGRINVATGDAFIGPRPEMMMRAAPAGAAAAPPVSVEPGSTELTVTVTGDAVLSK